MTSGDVVDVSDTVVARRYRSAAHREQVERIYEDRWGVVHHDALDDIDADSDGLNHNGLVATPGDDPDTVYGFLLWHQYEPARMAEVLEPANVDCSAATRLGYVQMLAVAREHESQGVGSTLLQRAIRFCRVSGETDYMTAVCWHRDDADHYDSRALFEKHGFGCVETVEHYYWQQETSRTGCPDCIGVCECTASVYAREVTE